MKVVFISYLPITDKKVSDFRMDELEGAGCSLEYWDLSLLVFGAAKEPSEIKRHINFVFRSYREFVGKVRANDPDSTLYVSIPDVDRMSLRYHGILKREHCRVVHFMWGALPFVYSGEGRSTLVRIRKAFIGIGLCKSLEDIVLRYKRIRLAFKYDMVFYAGSVLEKRAEAFAKRIVGIECPDVVEAGRAKAFCDNDGNYAVFLDEYFPLHPDFAILRIPTINADHYYASMETLFLRFEKETGLHVIVAAHPKSEYEKVDHFSGRKIIKHQTSALVKGASCVLAHCSTSVSFAVLERKPLIFITTRGIEGLYRYTYATYIRDFARALKSPVINADKDDGPIVVPSVDQACVQNYIGKYLKSAGSSIAIKQLMERALQ